MWYSLCLFASPHLLVVPFHVPPSNLMIWLGLSCTVILLHTNWNASAYHILCMFYQNLATTWGNGWPTIFYGVVLECGGLLLWPFSVISWFWWCCLHLGWMYFSSMCINGIKVFVSSQAFQDCYLRSLVFAPINIWLLVTELVSFIDVSSMIISASSYSHLALLWIVLLNTYQFLYICTWLL